MSRFDKTAREWEQKQRRIDLAAAIFNSFKKLISKDKYKCVADLGAGTGLLAEQFVPFSDKIFAFDNSRGMLEVLSEKAKEKGIKNIKNIFFDADNDVLGKENFDLIISSMTFHHIKEPETFFKNCYNALKKGGEICIADLVQEDGNFHDDNEGVHHFGFDIEDFEDMMNNAGFKKIKTIIAHEIPKEERTYPVFSAYGVKL